MFSSSPRLNGNHHLSSQQQQQHLRRPNSSNSLQPSPISRPTTPNPTNNANSSSNYHSFNQIQSHHLTPISSPSGTSLQRTPTALNPNRPSRSPKPSPRLNPNSLSIDSTSSSEYSLSAAPINNDPRHGDAAANAPSQSVSPSFNHLNKNETVNINGKAMQREILESYLLGMANPVGVGNGNGTRKGQAGAVNRQTQSNSQRNAASDEYGLGLEIKQKATDYKEKGSKRKSTSNHNVLGISRLNSLGISDGMGGFMPPSSSSQSNPNLEGNTIESVNRLGNRKSRASFINTSTTTNHAGIGSQSSSFSQPLPQGSFNHYDHSSGNPESVIIASSSIYKASQQSPVPPPPPPPRSPRNKTTKQGNGWNAVLNSSPPSSSDYSQESSLHHGLQNHLVGIGAGGYQIENRRRSRSLSKIIAHDAAMGEQLRFALTPSAPVDQGRNTLNSFNRGFSDNPDGQPLEPSDPISSTSFKSKTKSKNPSRESKRIRSVSTSGLDLDSHQNGLIENESLRYGHHLFVGSDERERSSSPSTQSSSSKSKRRSRNSGEIVRVNQSGPFITELNGRDIDSSFDGGSLGSTPFKSRGGRQRSNSHCPVPVSISHQDQNQPPFLTNLNSQSILSTPTSKVKSRKSVQMSPRDQNARESLTGQVGNYDSKVQTSFKRREGDGARRRLSGNQEFEMVENNGRRPSLTGSGNGEASKRSSPSLPPVTIDNLKRAGLEEEAPAIQNSPNSIPQPNQSYRHRPNLNNNKPRILNNQSGYESSSLASVSTSDNNVPSRPPRSIRRASTVQPLRFLSSSGVEGSLPSPSLPKSPLSMSVPFDQPPSPSSQDEAEDHLPLNQEKSSAQEKNQDLEFDFITHSTDIEEQKRLSSNSMRRKKRNSALSSGKRNSTQAVEPDLDKTKVELEEEETRAAIEAGERSAAARMTVRGRVRRTQLFENAHSNVNSQDLMSNSTIVTSQTIGIGLPSQAPAPLNVSDNVRSPTSHFIPEPTDLQQLRRESESSNSNPHAEWLKDQERRLAADDLTSIARSHTTEEGSTKAHSESDLESADRIRIHSATASEQGRSTFDGVQGHFGGNSHFAMDDEEGDGDVDGGVEWEMMPSPLRQGIDSAIEMWRRSTESFRNSEHLEVGIGLSNAGVALRKLQESQPVLKEEEEETQEQDFEETTEIQIKRQSEKLSTQSYHDLEHHQPTHQWLEGNGQSSEVDTEAESQQNCFSAELEQFEMIDSTHQSNPQNIHHHSDSQEERRSLTFAAIRQVESPRFATSNPPHQGREEHPISSRKATRKNQPYVWAPPEPSIVNSNSGTTLGSSNFLPGSFPNGADALDALDQPLRLYQDGMRSNSRSTITNEDSREEIDFTTGLGLFFNPPALSAKPAESRVPVQEVRAPNRSVRLSCHDLATLCDAAQLAISDEEREGGEEQEDDDEDDDGSSVASFASAEEGEDGDWSTNSRRASRVSVSWGQAAENFERQYTSSSRDSVSWRTSMAFNSNSNSAFHSHTNSIASSDRRRSIVAQEAAASIDRRLSLIARNHHRASRQFQLASHYEERVEEEENFLMENDGDHLEEDDGVQETGDRISNFEFEMVNGNHNHDEPLLSNQDQERDQVPILSRPASISTTEDGVEIPTPSFQTFPLPIPDLDDFSSSQQRLDYEYQHHSHSQPQHHPAITVGPGDADSDPEDRRLSSIEPTSSKKPSSRRWSAVPPATSNPIRNEVEFEEEQEQSFRSNDRQSQVTVFEKEEHTGIASRRLSRRASVVRKGNERRKSVQSRKRLTALMTSMPLILVEAPSHSSWRSSLPLDQFEHLLSEFGPKEMHRQEVIWELIETEASFVHTVCGVQKVFALPLRHPDGRWINGVPSTVARLFDWLEDIFQFHSKLAVALERARSAQSPVALEVAEAILKLVPKLEVYQPYLMRFEAVTALIEEMLRDEDNVFGEFLKMQMLRPECGSLSFSSFLLKPVQRLMKYPLFFKQLFELTPPNHPDHDATKELHQKTEQLVRDMNNVKAREEDYATLKDLESRLRGLPNDFHIAIRERKLLRQGPLCCVSLNEREQEAINSSSAPATPRSSPSISSPILTGSSRAQFDGPFGEGMSKLMPITNSEYRPLSLVGRSSSSSDPRSSSDHQSRNGRDIANDPGRISIWSNASSFSAASYASDNSRRPSSSASQARPESFASGVGSESSTSMYEQPQRPPLPSRQRSAGPDSLSPQLYSLPASLPSPTLSRRPSMASILLRNSNKHEKEKEREMTIQAFVFSDILVLCTLEEEETQSKQSKSGKKNKAVSPQAEASRPPKYNVLEGVGIGRVLSVTDHSGKIADRPYLLELVILPMRHEATSRNLSPGPTSLLLSFKAPAGEHPSFRSAEQNLSLWMRALQRSLVTSLKLVKEQTSLLSPQLRASSGRSSEDSLRRKRDSILSSGLSMASRFPTHVQTAHSDWTRRSKQVTELVMVAARSGDKTSLVGLLQSGLPFPKSPSQQDLVRAASEELKMAQKRDDGSYSHRPYGLSSSGTQLSSTSSSTSVVGDNVLDEVEEEREERKWWALRLSEVRADVETEREIDRMVEQLRSGSDNRMATSARASPNSSPLLGGNGLASHRWSTASPNGVVSLGLKGGRKVREGVKVVKSGNGTPPMGQYQSSSKENINNTSGAGVFKRRER